MTARIKVIAFDLDDTLWDSRPVLIAAEKSLSSWLESNVPGLAYTVEEMRDFRNDILRRDPQLIHYITELRRRVIETALLKSGIAGESADSLSRAAMDVFLAARNRIELSRDTLETISALAGQYTLGSLTNGNADIGLLGLSDYFSFAFSAEDVGAAKPDPALFRAAMRHTGAAPHEMVYVGDDPILDIDPANDIGLHTIQIENPRRMEPGKTRPDQAISDITELPAAIDRL